MGKRHYRLGLCVLLFISCITIQVFPICTKSDEEKSGRDFISKYVNNEILLKMTKSCSEEKQEVVLKRAAVEVKDKAGKYVVVKAKNKAVLSNAVAYLGKSTYVEMMEPNYEYEENSAEYEDEEVYQNGSMTFTKKQWALKNDGSKTFTDWTIEKEIQAVKQNDVNVTPFWNLASSKKSKRVIVALIDSGVDLNHPALKGKLWKNTKEKAGDGIDNDKNGYVDDYNGWNAYLKNTSLTDEMGHGTHCAGIMAANGTHHVWGVTGKSNVRVMPVKVFCNSKGRNPSECTATSFSILAGLKYAEKNGAAICNLSLGMKANDKVLQDYIKTSDMLFVCAAGNDGKKIENRPIYPAMYNYKNVIAVANMRWDGKLHSTSNYSKSIVDIAAPGTEIYSTLPDEEYGYGTGTSMAAPYVSGAAALLYSYTGKMNAAAVRSHLIKASVKTSSLNGKITGGRLNISKAYTTDVTAPCINYTKTIYKSKGYAKIKLNVSDYGIAGVKYVRWRKGSYTASSFINGKKGYKVSSTGYFTVKSSSVYTIYAVDKKGNQIVKKITVKIPVPSGITLKSKLIVLDKGKSYKLSPVVSPKGVYAKLKYTSGNNKVAVVSANGKVTAKRIGKTSITIKTQNGKKCTCSVLVK